MLTIGFGIITLPALTKSYSTELYGIWTQVGVTVGLLTPIIMLHLSTAVVRYLAAENDKRKRQQYFGSMLWPVLVLALLITLISLIFKEALSLFIFSSNGYEIFVLLTFLWVSTSALFGLAISYLRARGKIRKLSIINITFTIVKMLVIVFFTLTGYQLEYIIISIIAIEGLLVITIFGMIIKNIGFPWPQITGLCRFLSFSIPQIPSGILLWIVSASDRYFITHMLDLSQTGIYNASYNLGSLIAIFFSPISFVLLPSLSKFWENKDLSKVKNYLEYSNKLFLSLAIPGVAGLHILSQPLLKVLAGSEYAIGAELVSLIALGTILLGTYQINLYVVYLVEKTKFLPFMIAIAAGVNAAINIILIPQIGVMGAVISTIAAYFILVVIVTIWARKVIRYKVDILFLSKVILATVIMALLLSFLTVNSILIIGFSAICAGAVYFICLVLLKAFTKQDILLLKVIFKGF